MLGRGSVLLASALWLGGALLVRPGPPPAPPAEPAPPAPPSGTVAWALAGTAVAAIVLFALAFARNQLVLAPGSIDILNFHLPGIARWIQTGSLWDRPQLGRRHGGGQLPNKGDLVLLAAVLPWHSDFLSHLVPYAFYGLTGLTLYAVASEVGAPRAAAVAAACLFLALPVVIVPALVNSFPDAIMLAGFGAGLLFLLRHRRTGATSDLVLAGLALGISFGTKWYAVSAVAIVVAVWLVAPPARATGVAPGRPRDRDRRRPDPPRRRVLAAAQPGRVRQPLLSGQGRSARITIFAAPHDTFRDTIGFSVAHYLTDWAAWRDWIIPGYRNSIALPGAVLGAGLLIVIALAAWDRTRARFGEAGVLWAGIACALLLVAVYAITPYTAGGFEGQPVLVGPDARYAIPALLIAAVLTAWATRVHRFGPAVLAVVTVIAMFFGLRLASNGTISGGVLEVRDGLEAALVLFVVLVIAWGALALRDAPSGPRRVLAGAAAAVLILALAGFGGWRMQETFIDQRYAGLDPTTDWIRDHAPPGSRIGVASTWGTAYAPPLPAFGPRFENEVSYVGPVEDEMLREYDDGAAFGAALDGGGYDYLIIGRGDPGGPPAEEEEWARQAGWRFVVGSSLLRLFRAPGAGS